MENSSKRYFLVENRGKYIDISFFSSLFSGLILTFYTFLLNIFSKAPIEKVQVNGFLQPNSLSGVLLMHTSFAFILGLILGYNKKISFNLFIIISVILGTLFDCSLKLHRGSIASIIVIGLCWFVFSIVFLVFEKIFSEKNIK